MILIDALYINKGGGAVLLRYLIGKILVHPQKDEFFFLLDPRFDKPTELNANYVVIENKLSERIKFYKRTKKDYSKVFCFANTPPPIKMSVPVYTYSHNQKLFEAAKNKFNRKFFKLYLKYLVIKLYNKNTDYYIVQTPHMVDEIVSLKLKDEAHCLKLPFYDHEKFLDWKEPFDARPADEFVFISTPSPQKNYPTLLSAWEYLFDKGYTPLLHVTIDDTAPALLEKVAVLQRKGVRIQNYTFIDARVLYFTRRYLVFPSIMESFGLPLVEAVDSGMKVLASNLPYVQDVITPSLSFDPLDKVAIADMVIKALETNLPQSEVIASDKIDELLTLLVK